MSLLNRRWSQYPRDEKLSGELSKEFNISSATSQVLINRGIKNGEEASSFINPRLSGLKDPFEIPNMKKAAGRVLLAKERGEKVTVYGDFDVDGVTATAIVVLALRTLGIETSYYIPHRYGEGYGMHEEAVSKIAADGTKLIITVDCGITNAKEIEKASSLGMDVIVTDHHNIPKKLPKAYAVVDPKMMEDGHPSKNLAGAGVAFKFVWAVFKEAGIKDTALIKEYLDLAALGTVADVVPLTAENRVIVVAGIKVINENKRVGIKHLISAAGVKGSINSHKIAFMLAPRLNSPGRLEHAGLSLELLLENDPSKANEIAARINKVNSKRQEIGSLIGEEALSAVKDYENKKIIVLSSKGWHPGVIGIVASKICEKFNRPAILIGIHDDKCRGSARSIEGCDVYSLLAACSDLFTDFGGHKDAAGFEMKAGNIEKLKERLSIEVDAQVSIDTLAAKTRIDCELDSKDICLSLAKEMAKLEPFGQGNPHPVLMSRGLKVVSKKAVGTAKKHLKLKLTDGKAIFEAIGFGIGDLWEKILPDSSFDFAYSLKVSDWSGYDEPELELIDIRGQKQ